MHGDNRDQLLSQPIRWDSNPQWIYLLSIGFQLFFGQKITLADLQRAYSSHSYFDNLIVIIMDFLKVAFANSATNSISLSLSTIGPFDKAFK